MTLTSVGFLYFVGSDIYVSGGQSSFGGAWNCYMWKFSSMHLVWREVAQLPGSGYLRHHTMLSGKRQGRNVLYLVGGFQQYRIISNKAFAYQLPHGKTAMIIVKDLVLTLMF